ncbi:MAG: alpha/beta fold hydrolase [Acidimicrobiales bacterium]
MQLPRLRLSPATPVEGHVTWHRTVVQGRPANYGVAGSAGAPVVFLHGWGLGTRAYKRAISRLAARGCRVFAPALPSFGGTADLPDGAMTMAGYAEWVTAFMGEVGIDEAVLLFGHSFGGGVAITLAERHPDLVSYVVLLNAIGGVSPRPPWAWLVGFGREFWPPRQGIETIGAIRDDVIGNLLRNPRGMTRAARLAQGADLRDQLAAVRRAGLPVLALTSQSDAVIPRDAFEALCDAVGTDGQVVYGGHSWLLADPDAFDEVLGAFVDLQVAEHRSARAPGRAADVRRLLRGTRFPDYLARALLRKAPPLWLMSDPAEVLAADVALCHPKLGPGEVRAAVLPLQGSAAVRLSIVTTDRRGLLADSAAVLAADGLSISRAAAATWVRRGIALHSFVVEDESHRSESDWERIGEELKKMVVAGVPPQLGRPVGPVRVAVRGSGAGRSLVEVTARDQVGLLAALCRGFAALGADIEAMHARTAKGDAHATFIVTGDLDEDAVRASLDGGAPNGRRV